MPFNLNSEGDNTPFQVWKYLKENLVDKDKIKEKDKMIGFNSQIRIILPEILFNCDSDMES